MVKGGKEVRCLNKQGIKVEFTILFLSELSIKESYEDSWVEVNLISSKGRGASTLLLHGNMHDIHTSHYCNLSSTMKELLVNSTCMDSPSPVRPMARLPL